MKALILFFSMLFMLSCANPHQKAERKPYHALKDTVGYAYQDDDLLWHLFIYNEMSGLYDYQSTTTAPSVSTEMYSFEASHETVSNFSDAVESGMTESVGEDVGGFDADADATDGDSGMSESSGEDAGGSDSGSDAGGSDGGGGDGGGGGE